MAVQTVQTYKHANMQPPQTCKQCKCANVQTGQRCQHTDAAATSLPSHRSEAAAWSAHLLCLRANDIPPDAGRGQQNDSCARASSSGRPAWLEKRMHLEGPCGGLGCLVTDMHFDFQFHLIRCGVLMSLSHSSGSPRPISSRLRVWAVCSLPQDRVDQE